MSKKPVIGISGPVNLQLLNWNIDKASLPETNAFPLTSHLVNALLNRGYEVICYTNSNDIEEQVILSEGSLTVCIGRTKPQAGRRLFKYEIEELTTLMVGFPADVIYAFWSYEYAWAGLDSGIPTIVSVHDVASRIFFTQPDIFRLVRWYMSLRVLSRAKHVVANSDYTYKQLTGATKRKATILYNFYDSSFQDAVPQALEKQNYIASISMGFTKRKGVPASLKAFALLRKKHPTVEYHLIGVGMEPGGEAEQFAREHNLADGVKFLGPLPFEEVLREVVQAKVLVHASVEESFGMAVLEAMVMGTAVVGGQKSGFVPYLLHQGHAGVLCDISKPAAIAAATDRLLTDHEFANSIVANAKAYAKANFSEEAVVDKLLHYIYHVLKRPAPATNPTVQAESKTTYLKDTTSVPVHEA